MIWFTADNHYFHTNIIRHANRSFSCAREMNEIMIERYNKVIGVNDQVYILGDFSLSSPKNTIEILKQLKGRKFLVRGNHDKVIKKIEVSSYFEWVKDYCELNINNKLIVMCHYPMLSWRSSHYGSIHLHGHCHGKINELNKGTNRIDVGVDSWNFSPVNYEQIERQTR